MVLMKLVTLVLLHALIELNFLIGNGQHFVFVALEARIRTAIFYYLLAIKARRLLTLIRKFRGRVTPTNEVHPPCAEAPKLQSLLGLHVVHGQLGLGGQLGTLPYGVKSFQSLGLVA